MPGLGMGWRYVAYRLGDAHSRIYMPGLGMGWRYVYMSYFFPS